MRAWLPTLIGVAIILITGRDILHEMFHPEDTGSLSRWVMQHAWQFIRRISRGKRSITVQAGPIILVIVALMWTALVVFGWALIYWPRMPQGFNVSPGVPASASHGFPAALYVSLAAVTTLSAGNLTPITMVPRVAATIESFVGPIILTAWITWVLSIYPILADRRAFAYRADLLRRTYGDPISAVRDCPSDAIIGVLQSLTNQMLEITAELRQSRVTYYFQSDAIQASLTAQLPYVLRLAREAERAGASPGVQHHGCMLRISIDEFLDDVGAEFVDQKGCPPDEILAALARDHFLPVPGTAEYEEIVSRGQGST
jgi:hypothetical protein